jgi:phosphatidylcholine synthase
VLGLVLLASAFGFCQDWAKTEDGFFTGFPSYWNVVVFYFYVLRWPPEVNALILFVLAVLVFVPLRYVYPSKTKFWRPLTLVLGALWAALLVWLAATLDLPNATLAWLSLAYPAYYFLLSLYLHFNRPALKRS